MMNYSYANVNSELITLFSLVPNPNKNNTHNPFKIKLLQFNKITEKASLINYDWWEKDSTYLN